MAASSGRVLTSEYAILLQTSTSYIYTIAFSAGLNGLQVDQVSRENDSGTATCSYTKLVASKLVTVCNTYIQ